MKRTVGALSVIITLVSLGCVYHFMSKGNEDIIPIDDVPVVTAEPYEYSDFSEETSRSGIPLTEIQVTPEDILSADSTNKIGTHLPFNSTYITKKELDSDIISIEPSFEQLNDTYKELIRTLRHIEMLEGVSAKNSKVGDAVKTYLERSVGIH